MSAADSTIPMVIWLASLIIGGIVLASIPVVISRAIRNRSIRRLIAHEQSMTREAVSLAELFVRDNPELEAKALRIVSTKGTIDLHTAAHCALARVDDRRGNFASMRDHLRFAVSI